MAAAGEQPHGRTVPPHDQPVPVMLDFVRPDRPNRRLGGTGGNAWVDKPISANAVCEHPGRIAARPRPVEWSQCRRNTRLAMRCIATQKSFRIPLTPAKPDQFSFAEVGVVQGGVMRRPEDGAFDPETVKLLRGVLDDAWEGLSA
jgi:hypothetical protein